MAIAGVAVNGPVSQETSSPWTSVLGAVSNLARDYWNYQTEQDRTESQFQYQNRLDAAYYGTGNGYGYNTALPNVMGAPSNITPWLLVGGIVLGAVVLVKAL